MEARVAKLRINITMSLDGYVAGPGQELHVVPLFLGGGSRLFEKPDGGPVGYECVRLATTVAHHTYVRRAS